MSSEQKISSTFDFKTCTDFDQWLEYAASVLDEDIVLKHILAFDWPTSSQRLAAKRRLATFFEMEQKDYENANQVLKEEKSLKEEHQ